MRSVVRGAGTRLGSREGLEAEAKGWAPGSAAAGPPGLQRGPGAGGAAKPGGAGAGHARGWGWGWGGAGGRRAEPPGAGSPRRSQRPRRPRPGAGLPLLAARSVRRPTPSAASRLPLWGTLVGPQPLLALLGRWGW